MIYIIISYSAANYLEEKLLNVIIKKDIINNISSKKHSNLSNNGIRKKEYFDTNLSRFGMTDTHNTVL